MHQQGDINHSAEWVGDRNEPLKGFSWKPGVSRNTSGIVFWSDVFLYDSYDGGKYAIMLIDTQGLFDHDTLPAINAKIFSFTTLISSLQIFNLASWIQEDHLEYLQV
jgi:atlastin